MTILSQPIEFTLPDSNVATDPPERRGVARDGVRLMVAHRPSGRVEHRTFHELIDLLNPGDVLVVNTSRTIPAALDAVAEDGTELRIHLASPMADGMWSLEVRTPEPGGGTSPGPQLKPQTLTLPGGAMAHLLARSVRSSRLWIAVLEETNDLDRYLSAHGRPIRYLPGREWPLSDYQTVFATDPGSSEMPSAGRPFTTEMATRLIARGISMLPVTLHTGVSSFEDDESPGEEWFRVPAATATAVNALRAGGGRLIAVGTSVVRALETVATPEGTLEPGEGLTELVVTPERGILAVDGLLTGWHEPHSSHLRLLEAIVGKTFLHRVYYEALEAQYLWHEFGDELLIIR
ncbi:MAG: S-adenosylmethionine:tRNA ribosyltransferase-isomerase [Actinomycetota bacterium]|nr:S-adenosylmethionine:tRNA ribosyltransferase-isomerase [Actinomycetota bacterium]